MSLVKRTLSLGLSVLSTGTIASVETNKVVYGIDNRVEVYEAPSSMQAVAASTAAMMSSGNLTANLSESDLSIVSYTAKQNTLQSNGICADDRYATQPVPAMCSGFLVGPDLLVTAGHCIRSQAACKDNMWVFGFAMDQATQTAGKNIPVGQVYRCKELLNQRLAGGNGADHALVRLDRVVTVATPLKFRTEGVIEENTEIVVIGHPMGLPTKVADGAKVRPGTHPNYFVANLDTFGGNSGSAVFNTNDLTVEGILVRGETDYKFNPLKNCSEVFVCDDDKCRGEDVTRITDIIELTHRDKVLAAAAAGDAATIDAYVAQKGWINMYDNAGTTILAKAAQGQQAEMIAKLLALKADALQNDLQGKTPLHYLASAHETATGTKAAMAALIGAGVDINAQDAAGETALHAAVRANNLRMVVMLIAANADIKIANAEGKTALELIDWFNMKQRKMRSVLKNAVSAKK